MKNNISEKIAEKIKASKYCVILTGAGISTESGIPDFRSKGSGLYNFIPEETFSIELFMKEPEVFYNFAKEWLPEIITKEPNFAHIAVAKLEEMGFVKCIITQNIDGLHQKAGAKNVLEIHGNFRISHCLKCGKEYKLDYIKTNLLEKNIVPVKCKICDGLVKPDITFFGEMLPDDFEKAILESKKSDLMLILGSSLKVYPAAFLPDYCKGEIVIINNEATEFDNNASIVWHKRLSEAFKEIMRNFLIEL